MDSVLADMFCSSSARTCAVGTDDKVAAADPVGAFAVAVSDETVGFNNEGVLFAGPAAKLEEGFAAIDAAAVGALFDGLDLEAVSLPAAVLLGEGLDVAGCGAFAFVGDDLLGADGFASTDLAPVGFASAVFEGVGLVAAGLAAEVFVVLVLFGVGLEGCDLGGGFVEDVLELLDMIGMSFEGPAFAGEGFCAALTPDATPAVLEPVILAA